MATWYEVGYGISELALDSTHGVSICLLDGPAIPSGVLKKLFIPFSKSAAQAAATAPGVGLGSRSAGSSRAGMVGISGTRHPARALVLF
jgi:hypothetical protein